MNNDSPDKLAILATQIAVEMARGKNIQEINLLRNVTSQISAVLQTILTQKINLEKEKK